MSYSYDINADIFLLSLSLKKETLIRHNYPPYDFLILILPLNVKLKLY